MRDEREYFLWGVRTNATRGRGDDDAGRSRRRPRGEEEWGRAHRNASSFSGVIFSPSAIAPRSRAPSRLFLPSSSFPSVARPDPRALRCRSRSVARSDLARARCPRSTFATVRAIRIPPNLRSCEWTRGVLCASRASNASRRSPRRRSERRYRLDEEERPRAREVRDFATRPAGAIGSIDSTEATRFETPAFWVNCTTFPGSSRDRSIDFHRSAISAASARCPRVRYRTSPRDSARDQTPRIPRTRRRARGTHALLPRDRTNR